jgi:hypothetical protein
MALQAINAQPGTSKYTSVGMAPFYYDAALITGATYYLLRSLLIQLKNREFKLLIADPENNDVFGQIGEKQSTGRFHQPSFGFVQRKRQGCGRRENQNRFCSNREPVQNDHRH